MKARIHPWRLVRHLNVEIRHEAPVPGVFGWWDPDNRTIWVDPQLGQAGRRCTVMHELLHALRGDESCASLTEWHDRKQETAVEIESARRLLPIDQVGDVVVWTEDLSEAADELWVDEQTLVARMESLRPDEHDYLRRRMASRDGEEVE